MQVPAGDNRSRDELYTELIVSGAIYLDQASDIAVEVRRGMVIFTNEGLEAGRVAAITMDKQNQRVTHILLSRYIRQPEYRLVPISLIEQVSEEKVLLSIFNQVVNTLPTWHES